MAIDLKGRIPLITNPISSRLIWVVASLFILALVALAVGFHKRTKQKEALTEHRQSETVASEAATSNRAQVQGGQPGSLPPSLPLLPPSASSAPSATAPTPTFPPVSTVVLPGAQAVSVTPPTYQPPPTTYQRTPQTPYPSTAPAVDTREQLRAQIASRRQEREQLAIEGPTGMQEQRPSSGTTTTLDPAQAQLAQLESLMRQGPPNPSVASTPYPLPGAGPFRSESNEEGQSYLSQNGLAEKRKFAEGEKLADDYLKTTRVAPLSRWVVQRGTVIPASLPNQVVSDLPGDLIAEVVRDVYDSPTQKFVEIPAGSRLVGEYNSGVSYGQNRVQIVWTAIYFPDGTFIDLDRMPSHSADGSTGLKDKTDNHYKRLIAGVALTSLLSAGLQVSQNRTNGSVLSYPSTGQVIASGIGTQASQLGEQLTQRNMNIQPTLLIRPGEIFSVSVKKDMLFSGPYEAMAVK